MRFRTRAVLALLVLVVAVFGLTVATGSAQETERETFSALAQHSGTGPSGQTTVIIQIERWSTDAERDHLAEVLINEDMQRLADELNKQDDVGFIRGTGGRQRLPSVRLRYAREFREDGVRIIRLATDRPISFGEAVRRPNRTWDYQVSLIELRLDENDEGEGVLMAGVEFGVDGENNVLTIKHLSTNPVRLVNVRK